ncbi:hypothetical protein [Flavobacterium olei]|uniref:hypothetical protein n=1 Tax=Flavobacterium olei TaxID=1886782 RepID=UPI00321A6144
MSKITMVLKNFMLLCFLLLLANCGTNEIEDNSTASEVDEVKNWYTGHKGELNSAILEYIDSIKWENALISDGIDGKVIEVPFTLQSQLKSSNEKANLFNDHHRLVFIKGEESFQTYYVQIFTDDASKDDSDKSYSYYGMKNNFNGKVFVQDLRSNKTNVIQFKNGNTIQLSSTSKWREETYDCTFLGYWGEGGSFHPIKLLYCDGGGFDDGEPYPQYGGGGGGTGSGGNTNLPKPVKITDNLTGKAKCINDLLNQNGNSFIEKLLSNFEGNAKFNIVIGSADKVFNSSNEEINGSTTYTVGSNDIKILISTSKVEGISSLESARLILHEYIHADMLRKLLTTDVNDIEAANFREVYSRYAGEQYHSAMANQYMSSMKSALKDFHKNVLREDFDKYVNFYGAEPNDELYEAMAWNGLKEVDVVAWNNLTPEKKASINTMFNNVAKKLTQVSLCNK